MAVTATAPVVDQKTELASVRAEYDKAYKQLEHYREVLSALMEERGRVNELIATGKTKPESAADVARRIELAQAAVNGGESIVARMVTRMQELQPIVQRIGQAETLAINRAALAQLARDGAAVAARINAKLTEIIGEDLVAFDAIRDRMRVEFAGLQLNGPLEASRLIRLLKREDDVLVAETQVRQKNGWRRRSDLQLNLHNLRAKRAVWP